MPLVQSDLQVSTEDVMPVENFRSKEAYRKNMAYRHMHGIPMNAEEVVVGKKKHKVKHRKPVGKKKAAKATKKKRKVSKHYVARKYA